MNTSLNHASTAAHGNNFFWVKLMYKMNLNGQLIYINAYHQSIRYMRRACSQRDSNPIWDHKADALGSSCS